MTDLNKENAEENNVANQEETEESTSKTVETPSEENSEETKVEIAEEINEEIHEEATEETMIFESKIESEPTVATQETVEKEKKWYQKIDKKLVLVAVIALLVGFIGGTGYGKHEQREHAFDRDELVKELRAQKKEFHKDSQSMNKKVRKNREDFEHKIEEQAQDKDYD